MPYKTNSKLLLILCAFIFSSISFAAKTTKEILADESIGKEVRESVQTLVNQNAVTIDGLWSLDAENKLRTVTAKTQALLTEAVLQARKHSELTKLELDALIKAGVEKDNDKFNKEENKGVEALKARIAKEIEDKGAAGRKARPEEGPPDGALYIDVYQESPVFMDKHDGNGSKSYNMSFEVVTKYRDGQRPFFVRASLVSTGIPNEHDTSIGTFDIDSRHRFYVSHTYGSEMDYAQFFIGGIALHQTEENAYVKLGGPASHGCVRHHEFDAKAMFGLVGQELAANHMVNVKVSRFGVGVELADGSDATKGDQGFAALLTQALDQNILCTRHGQANACSDEWRHWN